MLFLNNIDLNQNELQNARVQNLASAPGSPVTGQIYYDTALGYAREWNGSRWIKLYDNWVNSVTVNAPITNSGTSVDPILTVQAASGAQNGYFSSSDFTKLAAATNLNTASTIVMRDASGDFSAGTITVAGSGSSSGLTLSGTVTNGTDAVTKNYVDNLINGTKWLAPVVVYADSNLALTGTPTIDGYTVSAGERVAAGNQTTGSQTGIYIVAAGAWTRASDLPAGADAASIAFWVQRGTTYGDKSFVCTNNTGAAVVGTNTLTFVNFAAGTAYTADEVTLTLVANQFSIKSTYVGQTSITTLGTITSGTWNGTTIAVANGGTGATTAAGAKTNLGFMTRFAQTIGDGSTTTFTITHNLGSLDVLTQIYTVSGGAVVQADVVNATTNTVTVTFAVAPTTNQYRVVVIG